MEKFREFLRVLGFKESILATILEISKQSVSNKLNGKQYFTLVEVKKIKRHFRLTDKQVNEFFIDSILV